MSKLGRNDPCPCGSRRKYKRCCLSREETPIPTSAGNPLPRPTPPLPQPDSPYIEHGFSFPPFESLISLPWYQFRSCYLNPSQTRNIAKVLELLSNAPESPGFNTRKLPQNIIEFLFQFGQALVRIQNPMNTEQNSKTHAIASCSCMSKKDKNACIHLPTALYALWSMIHRENPIDWDLEFHELQIDPLLNRPARVNLDQGIEFKALLFCPPFFDEFTLTENIPLTQKLPALNAQQKKQIREGIFNIFHFSEIETQISSQFRSSPYHVPFNGRHCNICFQTDASFLLEN